jgi:O-antigen/teichoic acid export membrane protein
MSKLVELFKGGAWLTLAEIAAKVSSALSLPVIARMIGPEHLGIYSIVFSLVLTAKDFSGFGVGLGIHRNGAQHKTIGVEAVGRLFSVGFSLIFAGSSVVALLVWIFRDPFAKSWLGNSAISPYLLGAAILIVVQPFSDVPLSFLAALHQFRAYAMQSSIAAIFSNIIPLALAWEYGLSGAIWGLIVASIFRIIFSCAIVQPVLRKNHIHWKLDQFWQEAKSLLQFGLPYYLGNTLLGSIVSLPLLGLVSRHSGLDEVGYIRVAISMASLMGFIPAAIGPAVISHLSANSAQVAQAQEIKLAHFRGIWSIVLVLNCGICLILPQIVIGLYGNEYKAAISLAWIHLWLTGLACISASLVQYLLADGKTGKIGISNSLSIVSTVIAAYVLIPRYGAVGYLVAQIAGQFLLIASTIHEGILSKSTKFDLVPIRNLCLLTIVIFFWTWFMFCANANNVIQLGASVISALLSLATIVVCVLQESERLALRKKIISKYLS